LDLVILVPDKDTEQAMTGLLSRCKSLEVRPPSYRILVHPQKDPGCYHTGHELVRAFRNEAQHALILFDQAWEGAPSHNGGELEAQVKARLQRDWEERAKCVVIEPELEAWVWSASPHVPEILGWQGREPDLRSWLLQEGLWPADAPKPPDPESAFVRAVRVVRQPPSAALFRRLAEKVSLQRCTDPAFLRLVGVLQRWFGGAIP
jgi:hypothetical protein